MSSFFAQCSTHVVILGIGRLNGVVSLVTMFEEFSHVMSPFWSYDKANSVIHLFYAQDFRNARRSRFASQQRRTWCLSILPDQRSISGIHLFVVWSFLHVPQTHWESFIAWDWNIVPSFNVVEFYVM